MSAEDMVERRMGVLGGATEGEGGATGGEDAGSETSSSMTAGVMETVLEDGLSSEG
jgi:hypothetical protein